MGRGQHHRRSSINQRSKPRRPRLRRNSDYRILHPARGILWLPSRARIRILELDPNIHRLPSRYRGLSPLRGLR